MKASVAGFRGKGMGNRKVSFVGPKKIEGIAFVVRWRKPEGNSRKM